MVTPDWSDMDHGLFSISVAAELQPCTRRRCGSTSARACYSPTAARAAPDGTAATTSLRLQQICALTGEGLNMAGIRRVLQLQEETRQLQAEITRLKNRSRLPG